MDLPANSYWNDQSGHYPWYTSFGSPSVSPNTIWMWSMQSYGEGMNMAYNFIANKDYCVEVKWTHTQSNNGILSPNSRPNIHLTPSQVFGGNNTGNLVPPFPTPIQTLFSTPYNSLTMNVNYSEYLNFNTSFAANNLWFYPFSDTGVAAHMRITGVNVCLKDPCQMLRVDILFKQKCQSFNFYPVLSGVTGTIVGYVWNFGDGYTSNLPNPNHYYALPGIYAITLTVYMKTSNGDCCKKEIKITLKVQ